MQNNTEQLREKFTEADGFIFSEITNFPMLEIPKDKILETAMTLRDEFKFEQLRDIVSVDRFTKNERFECIYNLYSLSTKARLFLKVRLDSKKPEVESLYSVWQSADWAEREAYDMMGIHFINHPDLRRIYMMEEYEYYPLRKDYPLMGLPGSVQLPKK